MSLGKNGKLQAGAVEKPGSSRQLRRVDSTPSIDGETDNCQQKQIFIPISFDH
jgi:hypothetical protein